MRQAGRILKPYRELKQRVGSIEILFNTPELAAEVTMMPVEMLRVDAAILFADIFTPIGPMGCHFSFQPGPVLASPVYSSADVRALRTINAEEDLGHIAETIQLIRAKLPTEVPLIGFAGAPITLATYLVEGSGAREFTRFRRMLHADPDSAMLLLDKLTDVAISYLRMQVQAGVQAVQLFDTWIGQLSAAQFETIALPYLQRIFNSLKDTGVPTIYFANGASHLLQLLTRTKAMAFSLDWRVDLRVAREMLGPTCVLQGNLDPAVLFSNNKNVTASTFKILDSTRGTPHIFNLGHGIHPDTPIQAVHTMIETIRAYR